MARSELDPYSPIVVPEDWKLDGFMLPYDMAVDMFLAWRKHGVMAVAGGYLDQPTQWEHDMRKMRKLFSTKAAEVGLEVRRKQQEEAERARQAARRH